VLVAFVAAFLSDAADFMSPKKEPEFGDRHPGDLQQIADARLGMGYSQLARGAAK
jgi:hypothetical protein